MASRTDRMTPQDFDALKRLLESHGQQPMLQALSFIPHAQSLPKIQAANALLYYAPLCADKGAGLVRTLMYWVDSPLDLLQTLRTPDNQHLLEALDKQWAMDLAEGRSTFKASARQVLRRYLPLTARWMRKEKMNQGLPEATAECARQRF